MKDQYARIGGVLERLCAQDEFVNKDQVFANIHNSGPRPQKATAAGMIKWEVRDGADVSRWDVLCAIGEAEAVVRRGAGRRPPAPGRRKAGSSARSTGKRRAAAGKGAKTPRKTRASSTATKRKKRAPGRG